jgi:hypothetical protein
MPHHRRCGRWYSASEIDRFVQALAETGNMANAAERIGRDVRGLYNRRRRDPVLAARCEAALAAFRCGPGAHRGSVAAQTGELRTKGGEWALVRSGPQGGPQLRRVPAGRLTEAGVHLFLRTVEATANLKLAARSVGVSAQAINYRRKRDLAFDQQVVEALKEGCQRLETQLLESALRGIDDLREDPDASPMHDGLAEAPAHAPRFPPMTAYEGFALLQKQRELLSRPQRWTPERDRQIMELATARLEKVMRRMKLLGASEEAG